VIAATVSPCVHRRPALRHARAIATLHSAYNVGQAPGRLQRRARPALHVLLGGQKRRETQARQNGRRQEREDRSSDCLDHVLAGLREVGSLDTMCSQKLGFRPPVRTPQTICRGGSYMPHGCFDTLLPKEESPHA